MFVRKSKYKELLRSYQMAVEHNIYLNNALVAAKDWNDILSQHISVHALNEMALKEYVERKVH